MTIKTRLAAAALLVGSVSVAQATTYNVSASFSDGGMQGETLFNGSFDWDGASVTNFSGLLSEAMWGWNSADSKFHVNGTAGGMDDMGMTGDVYAKAGGYADNEAPLLNLTHQLASSTSGTTVTTSVFLKDDGAGNPDTNVFNGGGYATGGAMKYGAFDGNTWNSNAYFTLVFDAADPLNIVGATSQMVYGACTALDLMGPMLTGPMCMTGHSAGGTMGALPVSLSLSVSQVPIPAAAWLFGGALMSLIGANRRKRVLPA